MNKIENMICEMCPEGVHWVKLEDIAVSICTGLNPRTNFKLNTEGAENYYVTVKEINTNKITFSSNTDRISDDAWGIIERRSRLEKGDVLFSGIGTIGKVAYVDIEVNNWNCSESVFLIKPKQCINGKYLTYILRSDVAKNQYEPHSSGSIMKGVRKETLKSLQIPLPPLSIQEKIVEILEKFSLLSAELEAELEGRRKQYEYYRTRLLSFDAVADSGSVVWKTLGEVCPEGVRWVKLGEVAKLSRGRVISKDYLRDNPGEYPVFSSQTANNGELGKIDSYDYDGRYLTWTTDGAYAGTIFRREGKFNITNVCGLIDITDSRLNYDFAYYWLSKTARSYVYEGMGNPKLMSNVMATVSIPLPPLPIQEEIVKILDKFEALVTDLSNGLPAEIEHVQKQYEYYRNKLLTFPEA